MRAHYGAIRLADGLVALTVAPLLVPTKIDCAEWAVPAPLHQRVCSVSVPWGPMTMFKPVMLLAVLPSKLSMR